MWLCAAYAGHKKENTTFGRPACYGRLIFYGAENVLPGCISSMQIIHLRYVYGCVSLKSGILKKPINGPVKTVKYKQNWWGKPMSNIVVIEGFFGGLTAVIQLKRSLGHNHKITVNNTIIKDVKK